MKVLISLPEKDNEYQVLQAADAVESARKLGLSLEIAYAENTPVLQLQQLMRSIRADPAPRALVIEPVSAEGIERLIGKAAGSGLGVAVLNCSTPVLDRMRAEFTDVPVFALRLAQRPA